MSLQVGELYAKLGMDDTEFTRKLGGAENKANRFGSKLKGAGTKATAGVTAPLVGMATAAIGSFMKMESGMNEVFTLMPDISKGAMNDMTQQMKDFSTDFGVLPKETIPALYQSISAGVPKDNVFNFLETAQKAAVGGVTDLETAVDGISSVVNSYGEDVVSSSKASDLMFTAVKGGKTTFDELSKSLFNVIPTASGLGVEFGDVTAALATMTSQGTPTKVATTQLRQAFVELSKEGTKTSDTFKEVSGKSFQDFIAGGGNVQDALKMLEDHADESGVSIADMFGSVEAGQAALALTGKGAEKFGQELEAAGDSAGATEKAYERMEESSSRSFDRLKAKASVALAEVGEALIPVGMAAMELGIKVMGGVQKAAEWFGRLSPPVQKIIMVVGGLIAALGPVLIIFGFVASAIGSIISLVVTLTPLWAFLGSVIGAISLPVIAVVAAIAALVAIGVLLYKNWDTVKEKASVVWEAIKAVFSAAVEAIGAAMTAMWTKIKEVWNTIAVTFTEAGATLKAAVTTAWEAIKGVFTAYVSIYVGIITGLWDTVTTLFTAGKDAVMAVVDAFSAGLEIAWEVISSAASVAWEALSAAVQTIVDALVAVVTEIVDRWANILSTSWEAISTTAQTVWDTLSAAVQSIVETLSSAVQTIVDTLSGALQTAWDALSGAIQSIVETLKSTVVGIWEALKSAVTGTTDSIKSALVGAWNTIKSEISGAADGAKAAISTAFNAAKTIVSGVVDTILSAIRRFTGIPGIISGALSGLSGVFSRPLNAAYRTVSRIASNIRDKLASLNPLKHLSPSPAEETIKGIKQMNRDMARGLNETYQIVSGSMNAARNEMALAAPGVDGAGGSRRITLVVEGEPLTAVVQRHSNQLNRDLAHARRSR